LLHRNLCRYGRTTIPTAQEATITAISPSATRTAANPLLHVLKDTLTASVASDGPDFTARQLSVFLKVYLEQNTEHTVRGLAAALNVAKPGITRALDRLQDEDFIKRETDSTDRRSVIVRKTPKGASYLGTISGYLNAASKAADKPVKT
jgi:DNA-binding MarR family transcriptional regulator